MFSLFSQPFVTIPRFSWFRVNITRSLLFALCFLSVCLSYRFKNKRNAVIKTKWKLEAWLMHNPLDVCARNNNNNNNDEDCVTTESLFLRTTATLYTDLCLWTKNVRWCHWALQRPQTRTECRRGEWRGRGDCAIHEKPKFDRWMNAKLLSSDNIPQVAECLVALTHHSKRTVKELSQRIFDLTTTTTTTTNSKWRLGAKAEFMHFNKGTPTKYCLSFIAPASAREKENLSFCFPTEQE